MRLNHLASLLILVFALLLFSNDAIAQNSSTDTFIDVSDQAGISAPQRASWNEMTKNADFSDGYMAVGQAWGDYDNDGFVDLYVTGNLTTSTLYHNNGDGTFSIPKFASDVSLPRRITGGATWVDYDNDGWKDLFVLAHGANTLFHNEQGKGFVDITDTARVGDKGKGTSAAWGDYDNDGFLDLYVTNWSCFPKCNPVDDTQAQDRLYHNSGNGSFRDVSSSLTYSLTLGAGFAVSFIDIDNDHDLDLYVVNDMKEAPVGNVLWRNDGPGCQEWCWTDISRQSGTFFLMHGMGIAVGDYNNDLNLDMYISEMVNPMKLLQNQGDGTFVDAGKDAGVRVGPSSAVGWGTSFFDYNNDGWLDLSLMTTEFIQNTVAEGAQGMFFPYRGFIFRNQGDGTFSDTTPQSWIDAPFPGMGFAAADYDKDGNVDFVTGNWDQGYRLHRNSGAEGSSNHWLSLQLVGQGIVNRDAVGARAYVTDSNGRTQLRDVRIGSSIGAGDEIALHFGLGDATVEKVRVVWPDGLETNYDNVPSDTYTTLTYPDEAATPAIVQKHFDALAPYLDVSQQAGIHTPHRGSWNMFAKDFKGGYLGIGQAWGDYDNDGFLDLYVTGNLSPSVLYHNQGDGTFTVSEFSESVSLPTLRTGGATWADYDNDGWKDLYVLVYGRNVLFHNEGKNGFRNVTETAGVGDAGRGSSATWGDYDQDGWLDLYVVNWSCWPECNPIDNTLARDTLYHNNGDGTFTDVSNLFLQEKLQGSGFTASFVDYDNDGDPDLYVVNDELKNPIGNVLWRNDGPGCNGWCWTDISEESGANVRLAGMGLAVGDYNNDLTLDFYFSNMVNAMRLMENKDGKFVSMARDAGVMVGPSPAVGWGTSFFDYNNDGWLDLYLATTEFRQITAQSGPEGMHFPYRPYLFENNGDSTFSDVTPPLWLRYPHAEMGFAYADYNNDGWVDFVTGNWNEGYALYRNQAVTGKDNHWLTVRLTGAAPINRDAIGARVYLTTDDGRTQMQEVRNGGSLGAGNDTALHFGLKQASIQSLKIVWPDGKLDLVENVAVDQIWQGYYSEAAKAAPQQPVSQVTEVAKSDVPTPVAPVAANPDSLPQGAVSSNEDAQVALSWFSFYQQLIQTTPGFTPPIAARAYGYASVTLYESLVPGMPEYRSLVGQLNGLTELPQPLAGQRYHWPTVANSALARITSSLFSNTTPENKDAIALLEAQVATKYKKGLDNATFARSVEYGRLLASAIQQWANSDGGADGQLRNFPQDYQVPTGPGLWVPTGTTSQTVPMLPTWGNNRTFVLKPDVRMYRPPADTLFRRGGFAVLQASPGSL